MDSCLVTADKGALVQSPGWALGKKAHLPAGLWILLGDQQAHVTAAPLPACIGAAFSHGVCRTLCFPLSRTQTSGFSLCPRFLRLSLSFGISRCEYFLPSFGSCSSPTSVLCTLILPVLLSPPRLQTPYPQTAAFKCFFPKNVKSQTKPVVACPDSVFPKATWV